MRKNYSSNFFFISTPPPPLPRNFCTPPPPNFFFTPIFFLNVRNSMKHLENMKFWKKLISNFICFHKKFKQHSINIKNYTAHPHHLVHVPAKFREISNAFLSYSAKTKRDGRTDRQTDRQTDRRMDRQTDGRGGVAISPVPGPTAPAGDNKGKQFENQFFIYGPKCKKNVYFGLFGGPEGGGFFNDQTGPILLSSYPLIHIYVHVK